LSGLIFFLALGTISLQALASLLEGLGFNKTPAPHVWRGKVREGSYCLDVIVRKDADGIQFILLDRSVPRDVCELIIKKLASKIFALVQPSEPRPEGVEILNLGPAPTLCHYCLSKIEGLPFKCHRCGKLYCSLHRLPETHGCPRDPYWTAGEVLRRGKGPRSGKTWERQPIIQELPCG
jgi:hypothetical protein